MNLGIVTIERFLMSKYKKIMIFTAAAMIGMLALIVYDFLDASASVFRFGNVATHVGLLFLLAYNFFINFKKERQIRSKQHSDGGQGSNPSR